MSGLKNKQSKITKSNFEIIKDNVFTLFNLYNLLIGIALALVGAFLNLFFLLIIFINILIGIIQEIRGRNLVDKLSLLHAQKALVIKGGKEYEIPVSDITVGDIIILCAGNQIPADAVVFEGAIEVNESLLTGESDTVSKKEGSELLSGSFVTSGKCKAKVIRIGANSFVNKLALEAKKHKKINSELLNSMLKVTKFTSFFILPIGILLFAEAFFIRTQALPESVITSSAALLGMLPKGLVLLISIALAAGVINLSKKKVLVQQPHAIETLAHVDVLCLDKTGTITEGRMKVGGYISESIKEMPFKPEEALSLFASVIDDNNATIEAVRNHFNAGNSLPAVYKTPFSSERKWSSVSFENAGTLILGAPEILESKCVDAVPLKISGMKNSGNRILYAAYSKAPVTDGELPALQIFAGIEILDVIRKNARETLEFFKREGVDVKIISGDNPVTVARVAEQAGIKNCGYADMTQCITENQIKQAAKDYSIFGRVSPGQKKQLIKAFKEQGHTVAMVGDGVNDVLALREADCGIALSCGSDASKQVSELVLTESDFTALPDVVAEGRRVVNNITRVSGIFFIKTIYSVLLSLVFIILNMPFPFMPIQITLIDLAIEGYPSLFMSFERETGRIKGKFLDTAIKKALPFAILILLNITVLVFIGKFTDVNEREITAIMFFTTGLISCGAVIRACIPFNKLRLFLASTSSVGFFAAIYIAAFIDESILGLTLPSVSGLGIIAALAVASAPTLFLINKFIDKPKEAKPLK